MYSITSCTIRVLALGLLLCGLFPAAYSQTNPFDLKFRLDKEELVTAKPENQQEVEDENKNLPQPPVNTLKPEEVVEDPADEVEPASTALPSGDEVAVVPPAEETNIGPEKLVESIEESEPAVEQPVPVRGRKNRSLFLFLMLIAAIILTTLTISSNKHMVNNILRAVLNDNYLNLMYREQKKAGGIHYYILYFVFAVNAGLFLYFMYSELLAKSSLPFLWRCVVLIGAIYVVRHLFMRYLSFVYPFKKEIEQFSFTVLIFNIFLGLLLLPINVFVAFSPEPFHSFFLYAGLAVFAIVYIFRQLRGIFISSRLVFNNKFYFFLYLCAVEIAPALLLLKYAGAYVS